MAGFRKAIESGRRASCSSSCIKCGNSSRRRCSRFCLCHSSFNYRSRIETLLLLSTITAFISLPDKSYTLDIPETTTMSVVNSQYFTTANTNFASTDVTKEPISPDVPILVKSRSNVNGSTEGEDPATTSLMKNLDENNEVFTVWIPTKHVSSKSESFETSLTEDLEETIRNAVKIEIENEQNIGSYSSNIFSALKNIPEAEVRQKLTAEILSSKYADKGTDGATPATVKLRQNEGKTNVESVASTNSNSIQEKAQYMIENASIGSDGGNKVFAEFNQNKDIYTGDNSIQTKDVAQYNFRNIGSRKCDDSNTHADLDSECQNSPDVQSFNQTFVEIVQSNTPASEGNDDDDSLSIVFEEQFTATEPPVIFTDERVKNLIDLGADLEEHETTTTSDQFYHSVIKKQGVIPIDGAIDAEENPYENSFELEGELEVTDAVTVTEAIGSFDKFSTVQPEFEFDLTTEFHIESRSEMFFDAETDIMMTSSETNPTEQYNEFTETPKDSTVSTKGLQSLSLGHHYERYLDDTLLKTHPLSDAAQSSQDVEKVVQANSGNVSRSIVIIVVCCSTASLFVMISVTMFLVSFQKQHGTLDIEMQERRCGKDDEDVDTCQKLLDIELPPMVITRSTSETEQCIK